MRGLITFLGIITSVLTYGQETFSYSKIKLKDGSELKTTIIENVPGDYIKIRIMEGQEPIISYDNIILIKHKNYVYHSKFYLPEGFYIDASYAMLFGKASEFSSTRFGMSLNVAANYRFNSYISLGVGVEPTALFVSGNYQMLPIYIHFTGNVQERRVSPVYSLDIGWSFVGSSEQNNDFTSVAGGYFVRPGIGVRFNKFVVGLSYQLQNVNTTIERDLWWGDQSVINEDRLMRNIRLSASVIF